MSGESGRSVASSRPGAGFTLIEAVLGVAVLTLSVAFLVPTFGAVLTDDDVETTRLELMDVGEAVLRYYADVEAFPGLLDDLKVEPGTVTGWQGPYLASEFSDEASGKDDYRHDHWREPYLFEVVGTRTCRIRSKGPDRADDGGSGDDIEIEVDISPALREVTMRELRALNIAVNNYNRDNLGVTNLSTSFATLLSQLQTGGYLPGDSATTARLTSDGWGNPYQPFGNVVWEIVSSGAP